MKLEKRRIRRKKNIERRKIFGFILQNCDDPGIVIGAFDNLETLLNGL